MTIDQYAGSGKDLLSSASGAEAVTKSDSVGFSYASKRLWVGTGGNVAVVMLNGTVVNYLNVPNGDYLYVRAQRVNSTNTTASDIIAEHD